MLRFFVVAAVVLTAGAPAFAGTATLTPDLERACLSGDVSIQDGNYHCGSRTKAEYEATEKVEFWQRVSSDQITTDEIAKLGRWYGAGTRLATYCQPGNGLVTVMDVDLSSSKFSDAMKSAAFRAEADRGRAQAETAIRSHTKFVEITQTDIANAPADSWFCTHAFSDYGLITVQSTSAAQQ